MERKKQQSNELRAITELWIAELDQQWHLQYEKLVDFKRQYGHCQVPSGYEQDKSLLDWVSNQRENLNKKIMQQHQKDLLNVLGFVWKVEVAEWQQNDYIAARVSSQNNKAYGASKRWNEHYEKLVEFKRQNGHCMVSQDYEPDKSFGRWVLTQRKLHTNNKLRQDRKRLLDELEFVWNVGNYEWHQQYEKLVEFKRQNDHCIVPTGYEQDKSFGWWILTQRKYLTNNKIQPNRKRLLDELEFVWNVGNYEWNQQYEKLVELKQKNGHCIVPIRYEQDMSFGRWVNAQRKFHANNKMQPNRKKLLDALGFIWKVNSMAVRRSSTTDDDFDPDSDAFTSSSVDLPNEGIEETEPAQELGHVRNRFEGPSPANRKRQRTCLVDSGQMTARTNQEGEATHSCNSVEENAGRDEENPKPSLVTISALIIRSDPDQQADVQEEARTPDVIPVGWTRTKLEPDW